jgi:hypothetical protein
MDTSAAPAMQVKQRALLMDISAKKKIERGVHPFMRKAELEYSPMLDWSS